MSTDLFERHAVIDVDTHLTEPPDVWTARTPSSMHDRVPHIERIDGKDVWMVSGERLGAPGYYSMAGWDGVMPLSTPGTYDEIDPSMYDPNARLRFLDEQGIRAQVLYPNVGGFGNGYFLRLGDREVVEACVHAYNDFLTDWCSADPERLLAVTALPFWDRDAAIAELQRCVANGHRAVNFCNQPQDYGQPHLADTHWDPVWAAAQEAGVSVSFHVGGGSMGTLFVDHANIGWMTNFAKVSSLIFMDNMRCIGDLIFGGVCHRFPDLKLVSVESGVGWLPSAMETFDWQWRNGGVLDEHPEYDLLPSEYFRRQIYGCFWFERQTALDAIAKFPDNILFESDYPHPTCQHPGPRSAGESPRDYANVLLSGLPDDVVGKVLHDNAAKLYGIVTDASAEPSSDAATDATQEAVPPLGSPFVRAHVDRHVLHLTIDRPDRRNAFTQDMYRAIKRAAIWSDRQADLDAVCITGTDQWFGAGGDLARRTGEGVTGLDEEWDGLDHFPFRHIERSRKIWVAKINGVCHAGGIDISLHCDVTVASDRARFRVPELLRGLPDPMMAGRLVASIGLARARYMIFTASELTAAQADAAGLVGAVVPHDELDTHVEWVLDQIRQTGPTARALLKRDINDALPRHDMTMFSRLPSSEMIEGMASFVERRPPVWPR